MIPCGVLVTLD